MNAVAEIFTVVARHITSYFLPNNYVNTSCQKAGVQGSAGWDECYTMIWEQIQTAKWAKSDLQLVWLVLVNACGQSGQCVPAIRRYMDNMTTLLQRAACLGRVWHMASSLNW